MHVVIEARLDETREEKVSICTTIGGNSQAIEPWRIISCFALPNRVWQASQLSEVL